MTHFCFRGHRIEIMVEEEKEENEETQIQLYVPIRCLTLKFVDNIFSSFFEVIKFIYNPVRLWANS